MLHFRVTEFSETLMMFMNEATPGCARDRDPHMKNYQIFKLLLLFLFNLVVVIFARLKAWAWDQG